MGKVDNYQKIYELLESDFLQSILKRGRNFDDEDSYVFWYVDIDDFSEFDFNYDEEEFLIDCLQQMEIKVYDRYGNEYSNSQEIKTMSNDNFNRGKNNGIIEKIVRYREEMDMDLRDEIIFANMSLVENVAKKVADEYRLSYTDLVQSGYEYLLYIIDSYDLDKIEDFFHYLYMRMMKHVIRKAISMFDYGYMDKKIIRDYLDAKKNVESVYGQTLDENPELLEEIIDLMVEEQGTDKKLFNNMEGLLNRGKKVSPSSYNQMFENEFRNTDNGQKYRRVVNTNIEPMGIEEFLKQYEIIQYNGSRLYDKSELMDMLNLAILQLSDREQKIIRMHFGLDGRVYSLEEIGEKLGRTKQAIHQREEKIIRKLNKILSERINREILRDYFASIDEEKDYQEEFRMPRKR